MQGSSVSRLAAREWRERCQAGKAGGRASRAFAPVDKEPQRGFPFSPHGTTSGEKQERGRERNPRSVRNLEVVRKLFNNYEARRTVRLP